MSIRDDIARYAPFNEQEERDKAVILDFMDRHGDAFLRSNLTDYYPDLGDVDYDVAVLDPLGREVFLCHETSAGNEFDVAEL